MANVIRLKRASGSDPTASDLVAGEPAVRTDTGELFFKKDDGSIAKVAGAGGGPDFKYLALRNAANNGAASYPNADFTLVTSGTTTAIVPTAANTLLVSVNGVIQKPNTGTSTPSEGFALSGSTIKFGANISAAPDFILYQESGGIGEPSDDTVSEEKLKVSNSPVNGYFLSAQSGNNGGLTWAAPVATSCTGNSATATALATARTINGTSFDGTANITVTAAAGTLTGNTLNSSVTASSLTSLGDLSGLTVTGNVAVDTNTLFVNASTNRVGIGTTSPDELLHIANTSGGASLLIETNNSSGGNLLFGDDASNTVGRIQYLHSDNSMRMFTASSERMRIDSSGNVGIGTTSPSVKTQISVSDTTAYSASTISANQFQLSITNTGAGGVAGLLFVTEPSSGNGGHCGIRALSTGNGDSALTFSTRGGSTQAERVRIDSAGFVGIGNTSPNLSLAGGRDLVIGAGSGDRGLSIMSGASGVGHIEFSDGTSSAAEKTAGGIRYYHNGNYMRFNTNGGTERMRINSSGQLIQRYSADPYDNRAATFQSPSGVSATYISIINTETNGQSGITFGDHAGQNAGNFDGYINYDHSNQSMTFLVNGGTERMRIVNDGRIGIGTNSPDQTLHLHKGSAGSISSASNSVLTLENSTDAILQFLTPSNKVNQIRFGDPSDNGAGYIDYNHNTNVLSFGTAGPEKMRIDSSGRVMIGATSYNTGNMTSGATGINVAGTSPQVLLHNTNADKDSYFGMSGSNLFIFSADSIPIVFGTNDAERMRLSASGNFGIGNRTTSPDELLHVHTSSGEARIHVEAATNARVRIRAHSGESIVAFADASSGNPGEINYTHSSDQMTFRTNGGVRTIINSDGHVLPASNNTYDLGSSSYRWRNVYTSDLNMSNEGSSNDVDGTWGSYTIQEGEESLFLINKRNGKKYKFNLTEVS